MTGRYDEEIPDHDERLHLRDRGVGRDIGRNPTYRGVKPRTRQDTRALATMESVGGYGQGDEQIVSMAARAISAPQFSGILAGGAGAVRGVSMYSTVPVIAKLRSDSPQGTPIWAHRFQPDTSVSNSFGDWGINFNRLYMSYDHPLLGQVVGTNYNPIPEAAASWVFGGAGGTFTRTTNADNRWVSSVATTATWTATGTNTGYVTSGSGSISNLGNVGNVFTLSVRYSSAGITVTGITVGGGSPPTVSWGPYTTINHGDGTYTLYRTGTVTATGSGVWIPSVTYSQPAIGDTISVGDMCVTNGASYLGFFDGSYSSVPNVRTAWAGAVNNSMSTITQLNPASFDVSGSVWIGVTE